MQDVSVILPTYNEKDNIVPLLLDIHRELGSRDHELIIVDDGSTDGTFESVSDLGYPYLRPFLRTGEKGLAAAIRYGIEKSHGSTVIIMDTDFNHDPGCILPMIEALQGCDCASASRFSASTAANKNTRDFFSRYFNIFIRITTGGRLTDYLFGYLAIKRDILDTLDTDSIFYGFGDYCIRLLLQMEDMGLTVKEVPAVRGRRRSGKSTNFLPATFLLYLRATLKLARWRRLKTDV